jgi:hypothetical protein
MADTDSQLWTSAGVKSDLPWNLQIEAVQNLRWDQGMSELESVLPEAGLEIEPLDWIGAGVGYRYISERSKSGDMEKGHRYHIQLGLKHSLGPVGVSYRLRYQRKNELDEEEIGERIRNRFGLKYSTETAFTPYASTELYTDPAESPVEQKKYRVTVGCGAKFAEHHRVKIGYRMQSELDEDDDGDVEHILLFGYMFKIPSFINE